MTVSRAVNVRQVVHHFQSAAPAKVPLRFVPHRFVLTSQRFSPHAQTHAHTPKSFPEVAITQLHPTPNHLTSVPVKVASSHPFVGSHIKVAMHAAFSRARVAPVVLRAASHLQPAVHTASNRDPALLQTAPGHVTANHNLGQ